MIPLHCIRAKTFEFSNRGENFKTNSLYTFIVEKMENQQELSTQAMSHKGEQRNKYTMEFKRKVINYAKENSYNGAARKFKINHKRVRE